MIMRMYNLRDFFFSKDQLQSIPKSYSSLCPVYKEYVFETIVHSWGKGATLKYKMYLSLQIIVILFSVQLINLGFSKTLWKVSDLLSIWMDYFIFLLLGC